MKIQKFVIIEVTEQGDEIEIYDFPYSTLPKVIIDYTDTLARTDPNSYYKIIMREIDEATVYQTARPVNSGTQP